MVETTARTIGRLVEHGVGLKGLDLAYKMLALGNQIKSRQRLDPATRSLAADASLFRNPLVILAGGCAGLTGKDLEMVQILPRALSGFRGAVGLGRHKLRHRRDSR